MINQRISPRDRRKGEANGATDWRQVWDAILHILIVLIIAATSAWMGMRYERLKGEVWMNEVPKSEYRGGRR